MFIISMCMFFMFLMRENIDLYKRINLKKILTNFELNKL
jgi:hypothetical protein